MRHSARASKTDFERNPKILEILLVSLMTKNIDLGAPGGTKILFSVKLFVKDLPKPF